MFPKVSVIVPVYNSEKYISKCIESILNQTYRDFELLIINDGSIDSSEKIIETYMIKDNRIKYFKQKNAGPSSARNIGIENSKGEFILFIDSDDTIDEGYIEKLLTAMVNNNMDIVCCGYIDYSIYGIFKLNDFWMKKNILSKEEFTECICKGVGGTLWGKIFSRKIIMDNSIRMNPKIYMREDLLFVLEYSKYCEKIYIIPEYLYKYNRMNDASISKNNDIAYLDNNIFVINQIINLLEQKGISNDLINLIKYKNVDSLVKSVIISESIKYLKNKRLKTSIENLELLMSKEEIIVNFNMLNNKSIKDKILIKLLKNKMYKEVIILQSFIQKMRQQKLNILQKVKNK